MHAAAFDGLAADYDADFSNTPLGGALRGLVWARMDAVVGGATRVLDLGCGTGEDALRLAGRGATVMAIDASAAMVQAAQEKARRRGSDARAQFHRLPIEALAGAFPGQQFDATISNFGALNCVDDLGAVARAVAAKVTPGGRLLWVLMGRHVPWEWAWFLLRADPGRAARRLSGSTNWRGMRIKYPTPGEVLGLLRPFFRIDALLPLGVALPPSYAAGWLNRHPRMFAALARAERGVHRSRTLAYCADHYIIEATRMPAAAGL